MLALAPIVALLPFVDAGRGDEPRPGPQAAVHALISAELFEGELVVTDAKPPLANEPDPTAAVRIAKALKADYVVMGAFDLNHDGVKLWARLFNPKGKMLTTASASLPAVELPQAAHLAAAGLARAITPPPPSLTGFAALTRPPLRSALAAKLLGEALIAPVDEDRRRLLQEALREDPTFGAVNHELELLDARRADANQKQLNDDAAARWKVFKKQEKDPAKLADALLQRWGELQHDRKYRHLIASASAVLADPPRPGRTPGPPLLETAQLLVVASWDGLADDDAVVREGHKFLARHPLSDAIPQVQLIIDQATEHKRRRADGADRAVSRLAHLKAKDRGDPCRRAEILEDEEQLSEARLAWEACVKNSENPPTRLVHLLLVQVRLGDYKAANELLEKIKKSAPAQYKIVLPLAKDLPSE
jgi:hypothetical protein